MEITTLYYLSMANKLLYSNTLIQIKGFKFFSESKNISKKPRKSKQYFFVACLTSLLRKFNNEQMK